MPLSNPRPGLLADLRRVGAEVERRLAEVEVQAETLHLLANGTRGAGAPGSRALLQSAQELGREVDATLDTIAENRGALGDFLAGMHAEMRKLASDTGEMEAFMGQYGWEDQQPVTAAMLDWSSAPQETPASAAEFPEALEEPVPAGAAALPAPRLAASPPTIFDIGLSDATMKMFLTKAKPKAAKPTPVRPTTTLPPASVAEPAPPGPGSPVLQLGSALGSLPPLPDISLSQSFAGGQEISPGLPRRYTPVMDESFTMNLPPPVLSSLRLLQQTAPGSPETPELQTMDLRRLVPHRPARQPPATPEEPSLLSVAGPAPEAETPETPVLSSAVPSTTPGAGPGLSQRSYRPVTQSPETPILKTMDIRRIRN